ncbi:hypothetical protein CYLTODRAFT_451236 [Cylindrobasidium torrendii FP15055 ss-10]|uniref:FAD-binding PCMH-type domain-containing protein n=1 Tax=Cylindrobasidium torrendii FP15055 ss-10 TaxID=1314674 RepID=A0A0D7BL99_9AGAR|nr:hypothetical protein CYLTODRAFT_451236 [Cylindrobasidium torrendii FP15055 ss-10]
MSPNYMDSDLAKAIDEIKAIGPDCCFEYGSEIYKSCIRHFLASSSEVAQLAVQPTTVGELSRVLKIIAKHRVPFAVRGGGHGMAPGYSSTTGILISMSRFNKVTYDERTQLATIGAGCLWDQVYSELGPTNRNVVGGAASDGVGVGGWMLGGGYSLKSNKYGLGIDNVVEIQVVTPDGRVRNADRKTYPSLFNALRGGGNNFGIVTKFVVKTFAQNQTYGSFFTIPGTRESEFKEALVKFVEEEDRQEACVVAAFRHFLVLGQSDPKYEISVFCVFDKEKPKKNVPFREFKALQATGEVWKNDPAGWQLGQTRVPVLESSATGLRTKKTVPSSRFNSPPGSRPGSRNRMRSDQFNNRRPVSRASGRRRANFDEDDEDDGYGSGDSVRSAFEGYFEEISHNRLYSVSSRPPRYTRHAEDSDDDEEEDRLSDDDDRDQEDDDDDEELEDGLSDLENDNSDFDEEEDDDDEGVDDFGSDEAYGSDDSEGNDRGARYYTARSRTDAVKARKSPTRRIMVTKPIDKMGEINERGRFGCLMISKYTKPLLDKMAEEAAKAARYLKSKNGVAIVIDAWPVHESIFDNSPPDAAFPHRRGQPYGPMLAYFRWQNAEDDDFWLTKLKGTLNRIRVVARREKLTPRKPALYNNLSIESVPTHKIYRENMGWLKKVKQEYDPKDVMGLCGGHKIPLPDNSDDEDEDEDGDSD